MSEQDIAEKLRASLDDDGRVSCAAMHRVARALGAEPIEVGNAATALDIQGSQCQVGLFGHGPKGEGKGRVVEAGIDVSDELETRIRAALEGSRLSCAAAWEVASEFKLTRLDLGNAAETLGIRISPCQLGFF